MSSNFDRYEKKNVKSLNYHSFTHIHTYYWLVLKTQYLPEGSPRAYDALYTANEIVNACDVTDQESFTRYDELLLCGICLCICRTACYMLSLLSVYQFEFGLEIILH